MSEDTDTTEEPEEPEQEATTEQPDDPEDERPELGDDDRAEIDLSGVAEDVEDTVNPDAADDGADDSEESADDGETAEDTGEGADSDSDASSASQDGETWGDMYVEVLAVVLTEAAEEYGGDDVERSPEEVAELAQQPPVNLPKQVNRLAEDMGGAEDLPPGQAVAVSTGLVAFTVLMQETDMAGDVIAEVTA